MTPIRPFLIQAYYQWLLENELTPHLVVNANWPGTQVPEEYVQEGQIVLNVHPEAVSAFQMGTHEVFFQARFQGVPRKIKVPYGAVLAIYSRENGEGTIFEPERYYMDIEAEYHNSLKYPTEESSQASFEKLDTGVEGQTEEPTGKAEETQEKSQRPKGPPRLKRIK